MKKLIPAILFFSFSNFLLGQQLIESSQYIKSLAVFNPAVAGTQEKLSANLGARKQWMGFEDAPQSQNINFQYRINKSLGFSAIASNHSWGLSRKSGVGFGVNYIMKANKDYNLSFGINTSLNQFGINRSKVITENPDDMAVYDGIKNQLFLDFGASIFASSNQFFWGISAINLLESKKI